MNRTLTNYGLITFEVCYNYLILFSAFEVLANPWSEEGDSYDVARLNDALSGQISHLTTDPNLCKRIRIEALYATAVEDQKEEVRQMKTDESLPLPEDIDYSK